MDKRKSLKTIMTRERLSANPRCPACGRSFTMGEPVVPACGSWGNTPQLIHEEDAVFDEKIGGYVEKSEYSAG